MFIKLYDSQYNFISLLDEIKGLKIEEDLEKGIKKLYFEVPVRSPYLESIREEGYIETNDYSYVIKEISLKNNNFYGVYCNPAYEELYGTLIETFDCYRLSPEQAYQYTLKFLDSWKLDYRSKEKTSTTIQEQNVMLMDQLEAIAELYSHELWYDTKSKTLTVYDKGKMGREKSQIYYSNELRLRRLSLESSTYDYATVLYPIGKDGLTISAINNGVPFLYNNQYTDKKIVKVWEQPKIDVAERLMGAGQDYLDEIAQPKASYQIQLAELGDVRLGDTIYIVDKIKAIKQKQRVVKITHYPDMPEKDSVIISNLPTSLSRTFLDATKGLEKEVAYIKTIISKLG